MSYEKQNFEKGQILKADHLNHMEDGIEQATSPCLVLDTSLKIPGAAADSKAVGDIIIQEHNRAMQKEEENASRIDDIESITANIKAHQNILTNAIVGNPIVALDSFSAPFNNLVVYGKSVQNGIPAPNNPVPIVSAGDGGSIAVKVTGKNLLNFLHDKITKARWTGNFTRNEEILTVSAVNGWNAYWFVSPVPGKQISVSFTYRQIDDKTSDTSQALCVGTSASPSYMRSDAYHVDSPKKSWTKITCNMISEAYIGVMIRVKNESVNEERTIEIKDFQLELGSTATSYSLYREQLLTLPTPNGLPGIPVTSGGNYTDSTGQQWICDEVDLGRGVKVQRVGRTQITSSYQSIASMNRWDTSGIEKVQPFRLDDIKLITRSTVICTTLPGVVNEEAWSKTYECIGGVGVPVAVLDFYISNERLGTTAETSSSDAIKALRNWLKTNPISFIYALATPIETPLTPAEIAAYKALTAYGPDTVVQASDGAGVKLEYQRDINTVLNSPSHNSKSSSLDNELTVIDALFRLPRTGKIYTVKIPKFASNQTTTCEKLNDNAGLVCEPSTDTVEGRDDYEDIPLFKWYNCNYERDASGHAYPTAIEGLSDNYATTGSVDVGVIQMAPYAKWDDSDPDYFLFSITDTPKEGYSLWCEATSDGTNYPYVIHSKYISGIASDGLLRSQPNLLPEMYQSYNSIINNYGKKGAGYFGASEVRNTWQIIFTWIKYAQKSSQKVFAGCTAYNFQYAASIQRDTADTFFPVTKAQAGNIIVGSYVSVGYGNKNGTTVNIDRGVGTMHTYAKIVKVLKIEAIDDNNSAVYLDIPTGFKTTPIALDSSLNANIVMSSMHWWSGSTDSVIKHHDGSKISNTNSKYPYRIQGCEYAVGGCTVSSDVIMDFQSDYSKNVLVCPKGTKRSSSDTTIRSTYQNIGNILGNDGNDWWIGDISLNLETGVTYPSAVGSSDSTGVGDRCYAGGKVTSGIREYLRGGALGLGSHAGSSCLSCWLGLGFGSWDCLAAD